VPLTGLPICYTGQYYHNSDGSHHDGCGYVAKGRRRVGLAASLTEILTCILSEVHITPLCLDNSTHGRTILIQNRRYLMEE
jgi:hypothetical protein